MTSRSKKSSKLDQSLSEETYFLQLVEDNKLVEIKKYLTDHPNLNIYIAVQEFSLQSALHIGVNNSNFQLVTLIIQSLEEYLSRQEVIELQKKHPKPPDIKTIIINFINMREKNGFSSLHCASFQGNVEILNFLMQKGGDMNAKNVNGMSLVHTAAQGDNPLIIHYLRLKGVDIYQLDQIGRNALHWACYYASENVVGFCLAWGYDTNLQDKDVGMTPLHLGANSGSIKIVQKLLKVGVDKTLKDKKNRTAHDVAGIYKFTNIQALIDYQDGLAEFFNIKSPTYNVQRRRILMIVFIVMYLVIFSASMLFVVPYVRNRLWIVFMTFFFCQSTITFLLVCVKDPGVVKKGKAEEDKLLNMLQVTQNITEICPVCEVYKPERSRHCDICDQCISVYDHHCPWVNNCIGARNYCVFYYFILSLLIDMIFQLIFHFYNLENDDIIKDELQTDLFNLQYYHTLHIISSIICITICIVFFLPLLVLFIVQTTNLSQGLTTLERLGGKKPDQIYPKQDKELTPLRRKKQLVEEEMGLVEDDTGYTSNAKRMFCTNQKNSNYLENIKIKQNKRSFVKLI